MVVIINLLPNVYWIYNNPLDIKSEHEYKIELKKQVEYLGVSTLVELDDKLDFWSKSKDYINDIKIQIEKEEFAKLLAILQKINNFIKQAYITNQPLLISTYKPNNIEIGLAIWLYFFNINSGITFDNVIKMMALKIIGNVTMTDTLKKFFALLNLNNVSKKLL
jgi:hypothetical protein